MTSLYIRNGSEELFQKSNKLFDDTLVDYDFDCREPYLLKEDDVNEFIDIIESLGGTVHSI